jgi:P-type Mg2+ transporter
LVTARDSDIHSSGTGGRECEESVLTPVSHCPRRRSPAPSGWHAAGLAELLRTDATVVHAGLAPGVVAASGRGAGFGRIAFGLGEHQPETGFPARSRTFPMIPGAAAYGCPAGPTSAVISGTLMSGADTGGMA